MAADTYYESIVSLHKQFLQSYKESSKIKLNFDEGDIREVIIAGMGGSIFGGKVVQDAFFQDKLITPLFLVSGYDLPAFADEKTLVIVTSYSGNTEEMLEILNEARSKGCKVIAITSGGMLGKFIIKDRLAGCVFKPKFNTSRTPRAGIGYIVGATIGVLKSVGIIDYSTQEAEGSAEFMKAFTHKIIKDEGLIEQISSKIRDRIPIMIGAEHLNAATYVWRGFLNETAKQVAFIENIPNMNHHFLDGLKFPQSLHDKLIFIFVFSESYNFRNKKRFKITRELMKKQNVLNIGIVLNGGDRLKEIFELIIIGAFVSLNLATHNKVDPSTNEMVDLLKKELSA